MIYWGHNPLTNHLLISWDIQVFSFYPCVGFRVLGHLGMGLHALAFGFGAFCYVGIFRRCWKRKQNNTLCSHIHRTAGRELGPAWKQDLQGIWSYKCRRPIVSCRPFFACFWMFMFSSVSFAMHNFVFSGFWRSSKVGHLVCAERTQGQFLCIICSGVHQLCSHKYSDKWPLSSLSLGRFAEAICEG